MQREFSAGGVVFKKVKESEDKKVKVLWLVTKSSPSELYQKGWWRLPKGRLDDAPGDKGGPLATGKRKAKEEEIKEAALKEVGEEGGVKAKIVSKIGTEKYFFTLSGKKLFKFVTFYLMEWLDDLPEGPEFETSEIAWLPYSQARKKLKYSGEKKMLDRAKALLDSGLQGSLV